MVDPGSSLGSNALVFAVFVLLGSNKMTLTMIYLII